MMDTNIPWKRQKVKGKRKKEVVSGEWIERGLRAQGSGNRRRWV
jgi:hypothetical protein